MSATATDPALRPPPAPLTAAAERLINGALDLDDDARAGLAGMDGKQLRIELVPPGWACTWRVEDGHLQMVPETDARPADITIRGGPAAFARLLVEDPAEGMPGLHLRGEIETARKLMRVFGRLHLDWEEALAARIGDGPAHRTARALRNLRDWASETAALYAENTLDYVREERRWLPTEAAYHRQQAAVDALRAEVDRLERRVAALAGERTDG